jgi:hypothetical protein
MRVLVVDDEPALRSAVQRALALERYDVALAEDGREALDRWPPRSSTPSSSTSPCRTSTASRSAGACARPATARRC